MRLFFFSFFFLISLEAANLKVEIGSKSAILMNPDTGAILFEKEAYAASFPASITKIATALYVLEKKEKALQEEVVATLDCIRVINPLIKQANFDKYPSYLLETDGIFIGIKEGEKFNLEQLLYGSMLASGNDASNVIAKHVSGSVDGFVEELNIFLKKKGILRTRFMNPHGLHHPEHITCAYDMALITKEALKHPFFREIVKSIKRVIPSTNKNKERVFVQTNRLLKPSLYFYPKAIGVKTGYVGAAGYNLVAAAEHEGRTLIAVVLGSPNRDQRYKDAIKLFDKAFKEKPVLRTLFNCEFDVFKRFIVGAGHPLEAGLKENVLVQFYPSEESIFKTSIVWKNTALPILEGQEVGYLKVMTSQGNLLKRYSLVALKKVDPTFFYALRSFIRESHVLLSALLLGAGIFSCLFYYFKKSKKFF